MARIMDEVAHMLYIQKLGTFRRTIVQRLYQYAMHGVDVRESYRAGKDYYEIECERLECELTKAKDDAEMLANALSEFSKSENWVSTTEYGPYGGFSVYRWADSSCPWDVAADALTQRPGEVNEAI